MRADATAHTTGGRGERREGGREGRGEGEGEGGWEGGKGGGMGVGREGGREGPKSPQVAPRLTVECVTVINRASPLFSSYDKHFQCLQFLLS